MNNNYSIIMAGGIGSRFWPLSTAENPKQFLDVLGIGKTLIQMTYERLLHISPNENIYIMTNQEYKAKVLEQLPNLSPSQVLTEPERKNTAPCIAYAAGKIQAMNPNANLIVCPADHLIMQEDRFKKSIEVALESSQSGRIATIGIAPTRPDTGYGYIEVNQESSFAPNSIFEVQQFREKPNLTIAEEFVASGNFFWNSGIFIWKASTIIDSLMQFQPELHSLFTENLSMYNTENEQENVNHAFATCEDISIDFAIMEHASNIDVVVADFDWSDLGTWGSLDGHLKKESNNNALIGDKVSVVNTKNCIINIPLGKTALIDGLDGYIVIQSEDKLMILKKENEQELKQFLTLLKK